MHLYKVTIRLPLRGGGTATASFTVIATDPIGAEELVREDFPYKRSEVIKVRQLIEHGEVVGVEKLKTMLK